MNLETTLDKVHLTALEVEQAIKQYIEKHFIGREVAKDSLRLRVNGANVVQSGTVNLLNKVNIK